MHERDLLHEVYGGIHYIYYIYYMRVYMRAWDTYFYICASMGYILYASMGSDVSSCMNATLMSSDPSTEKVRPGMAARSCRISVS